MCLEIEEQVNQEEESQIPIQSPSDLDACPRCGEPIALIVWGQTNCPRCGLHFECC
ncbi:MAG TPA: hypothetical protein VI776_02360 [Anaerolineales bacterium]|jgi:hypothetical protein|nr:hypothetical protein [Anaerolineales bacterium]